MNIERLLREHPVIDGHNDLLWTARVLTGYDFDRLDIADPAAAKVLGTHTDLPRLRAGGVGAQFWSVYAPSSYAGEAAVTATLEQIDAAYAMISRYAGQLVLATTADEVEAAWTDGKIASLLGAEGGHQINESLGVLRMYAELGVSYLTLTHNDNLAWADSATDDPVLGGLGPFGLEVVAELNRLGMMVDLSHVSSEVMRHALEVTEAPVIFSHSSARAVCPHPRNVPDDVLERLATNGGMCMVTFVPHFVTPAVCAWDERAQEVARDQGIVPRDPAVYDPFKAAYSQRVPPPPSRLADVVTHVEHVREVAGIDHVGLGGDYDGVEWLPEGLEDVSSYPRLLTALADRGWSEDDLSKLTCRNMLRVMREVAQTGQRIPAERATGPAHAVNAGE
ncbi:MAG: dipeptidase [Actinomycetota bacterium]|nr:dipeptidase [Actinomycetota bacterium]